MDRKTLKDIVIGMALAGSILLSMGATDRPIETRMVSDTYTVHTGDTIDGIAQRYISRNTGSRRSFQEFREGILELNYELLKDRPSHCIIYPGDQIQVNYWVKE